MSGRNPFEALRAQGDPLPGCGRGPAPWDPYPDPPPLVFPVAHGVQPRAGLFGADEPNYMEPGRR